MRKASILLHLLLSLLLSASLLQAAQPVQEFTLDNGMQLLVVEDHSSPMFFGAWIAHVGSANERPGITGVTHLIEHMMFKGTKIIGTTDAERDLQLIASQEELKEQMRHLSRDLRWKVRYGEYATLAEAQAADAEYQALKAKFDKLVEAQSETMTSNAYDRQFQVHGEIMGNAFTSQDMTAYFHILPANQLEFWMWMESDRLLNPVFREFYSERDVVYEERRMRTENTPTGLHDEAVEAMFWQAHPYSWPIIGWPSDISEITLSQVQEYFQSYYWGRNLSLLLTGDVNADQAYAMAQRYFGRIPEGVDPPALVTLEPEQIGEKRYYGEADVNTQVNIAYHCGGFKHVDGPVLEVISSLLRGDTGRLQRKLVQEDELAVWAAAFYQQQKYAGQFIVLGEVAEGHSAEELETALKAELIRLAEEPVNERELQKVKNNYLVRAYREESSAIAKGFTLINATGNGDWREGERFREKLSAVTPEQIQEVAARILVADNSLVSVYERPEGMEATSYPEALNSLPAEMQAQTKMAIDQMRSLEDPEALQAMMAELRGALGQVPDEVKPMFEIMLSVGEEQMTKLQSSASGEAE